MRLITYNGADAYLLDDPPAWVDPVHVEWSMLRADEAGLSRRETRRALSDTLRTRMTFASVVRGDRLQGLTACMRALTTEPVIMPFWPGRTTWSEWDSSPWSGSGLICTWPDPDTGAGIAAVFTAETVPEDLADDAWVAPALVGVFERLPEQDWLLDNLARLTWSFVEDGPASAALAPASVTFPTGPTPTGYAGAPKVFPVVPDFSKAADGWRVGVQREDLGFGRQRLVTHYGDAASRAGTASYTVTEEQIARLAAFFLSVAGPGQPFWGANWVSTAQLTADAAAGATTLSVATGHSVLAGDYLAIGSLDGWYYRKVASITATTVVLTAGVTAALAALDSLIVPLLLVRLDKPKIALDFVNPVLARAELALAELPVEAAVPEGETLSVTLGCLPGRVVLFEFSRDMGNGTSLKYRYTNFEADLVFGGFTWLARTISHGDIRQSLNLERDSVDIEAGDWLDNPLLDEVLLRGQVPLCCTIYHADRVAGTVSNTIQMFTGEVTTASIKGSRLKATVTAGGLVFDVMVPRWLLGKVCNHVTGANPEGTRLISAGCVLLQSDWKWTGLVTGVTSSPSMVVALSGVARVTGAAVTLTADWFAWGWAACGVGASFQRAVIHRNTAASLGALNVTLASPFAVAPQVGAVVTLYPGCDGMVETCQTKFGNFDRFGGQPFTPTGNPSLIKMASTNGGGGKKA